MPGGDGSSEEFVEDDSGGEEEEEEEEDGGDSSASYHESEEDDEDDDDDDDDGATGDDSDVFETPIKARKRPRTPTPQRAATSAGKNKRQPPAPPAASAAAGSSSKKKKGAAAAPAGAKGNGKGKAAAAAGSGRGKPSPSQASSSSPTGEEGDRSSGGGRDGGGKKSATGASVPSPVLGSVVRPAGGGRSGTGGGSVGAAAANKAVPAKTPKAAVSDYMQKSNRPYSYINVFDNLRKKIPKPMVQKLLDELVRDGTLKVQEYGKARIYYANQDALPNGAGDASAEKMRRLDQEAKTLTSRLETASKEEQQAKSRMFSLSSQPTDAALAEKLEIAARDLEQAEARNAAAKGQGRSVVAGGMKAAKSEFNKFRALWVDRKRNAMDAVDMIADGMDKKPKDIMEMLGLEPDEAPIPAKM